MGEGISSGGAGLHSTGTTSDVFRLDTDGTPYLIKTGTVDGFAAGFALRNNADAAFVWLSAYVYAQSLTTKAGNGININNGSLDNLKAGTAASPAVRWHTDTNTGLYEPATDTIGISCNGSLAWKCAPEGAITQMPASGGGLTRKVAEATATLSGASTTIHTNIPAASKLIGVQLRVDTLITGSGASTWDAAYNAGGASQSICTGQAFTKNTKINKFFDENANTAIASAEVDVVITPDAGTFTAGVVRAIVYYEVFETLGDAA